MGEPKVQDDIANVDVTLDMVLEAVRQQRGLDFRHYRRTTVERRVGLRLLAVGAATYQQYLGFLRSNPAELDRLIDNLTLKVSSFFREPRAFEFIAEHVFDEIFQSKVSSQDRMIRIWSAGCARGEEPYSLAITLSERLMRAEQTIDFSICATDIDREALRDAESGRYREESLDATPPEIVAKYFRTDDSSKWREKVLRQDIRGRVRFLFHDLVTHDEPPLSLDSTFDLVTCRNVFIYFQPALQERVLGLLHNALNDRGFLILGESESIVATMASRFECIDRKASVYRKMPTLPNCAT